MDVTRINTVAGCEVLSNGDVVLRLQNVCIQTAAKRARAQLVAACFSGNEAEGPIEAPLDLLGCFLERTDFNQLRSQHHELEGGSECRVKLHQGEDGAVHWEICRPS